MGLDSVEILMKVEKTFAISIPDEEAQKIRTVGDFHQAVWKYIEAKDSNKCVSQILFYKLRNALADQFGLSPEKIRLQSSPNQIFPATNRRQSYSYVAEQTKFILPNLVLQKSWMMLLTVVALVTIGGGLVSSLILIILSDFSAWTMLIPFGGILITLLLSKMLDGKRTVIQASTFREFTRHVLALNYRTFAEDNRVGRGEMEIIINHILADMGGVDLAEVSAEKNIGDDLGID